MKKLFTVVSFLVLMVALVLPVQAANCPKAGNLNSLLSMFANQNTQGGNTAGNDMMTKLWNQLGLNLVGSGNQGNNPSNNCVGGGNCPTNNCGVRGYCQTNNCSTRGNCPFGGSNQVSRPTTNRGNLSNCPFSR